MNKLLSSALVSVGIAALGTSVAFAQRAPGADARPAQDMEKRFAERPFSRPTERVEARLAYLKTALKITDTQKSQWDAFANFVRQNAQEREQRFKSRRSAEPGSAGHQRPNAIERLEKAQSFHAEAVTRINQFLAVVKPLYATLSPEQQNVADALLKRRFGPRHGPQMHERGGFHRG